MIQKLDELERTYAELSERLSDPAVLADQRLYRELTQRFSELEPVVEARRAYDRVRSDLAEAEELSRSDDPEMQELARKEVQDLKVELDRLTEEIKLLLLPKDPNDERNVLLEIRAGIGGSEAALFSSELFRMYSRYAERQGWTIEVLSQHETEIGGLKEAVVGISGQRVYSRLRYESGVHRVQRVPVTESGGRIHTSAATVAVLPEPDEIDVVIEEKDLRIDRFCSSGPGGQSVNTTASAIRITHIPTGEVVSCQDEKSQHKNKAQALRVLRSRLSAIAEREQHEAVAGVRRDMVGSGDRSERIRTYNFPQGRVTDHRIHLTSHRLHEILDGELDPVVDALVSHHQAQRLQADVVGG